MFGRLGDDDDEDDDGNGDDGGDDGETHLFSQKAEAARRVKFRETDQAQKLGSSCRQLITNLATPSWCVFTHCGSLAHDDGVGVSLPVRHFIAFRSLTMMQPVRQLK